MRTTVLFTGICFKMSMRGRERLAPSASARAATGSAIRGRIFAELASQNHLEGLASETFSIKSAHVLAEINAVHPFREGNGRTQLSFLTLLAENSGLPFNPDVLERDRVIDAMIESFSGNEAPLAQLFFDIVNASPSQNSDVGDSSRHQIPVRSPLKASRFTWKRSWPLSCATATRDM